MVCSNCRTPLQPEMTRCPGCGALLVSPEEMQRRQQNQQQPAPVAPTPESVTPSAPQQPVVIRKVVSKPQVVTIRRVVNTSAPAEAPINQTVAPTQPVAPTPVEQPVVAPAPQVIEQPQVVEQPVAPVAPVAPVQPEVPQANIPIEQPVAPVEPVTEPVQPAMPPVTPEVPVQPVMPEVPVPPVMPEQPVSAPAVAPIQPIEPVIPQQPAPPVPPVEPITPVVEPIQPVAPVAPIEPLQPTVLAPGVEPITPVEQPPVVEQAVMPVQPITPVEQQPVIEQPVMPVQPIAPEQPVVEPISPTEPVIIQEQPIDPSIPAIVTPNPEGLGDITTPQEAIELTPIQPVAPSVTETPVPTPESVIPTPGVEPIVPANVVPQTPPEEAAINPILPPILPPVEETPAEEQPTELPVNPILPPILPGESIFPKEETDEPTEPETKEETPAEEPKPEEGTSEETEGEKSEGEEEKKDEEQTDEEKEAEQAERLAQAKRERKVLLQALFLIVSIVTGAYIARVYVPITSVQIINTGVEKEAEEIASNGSEHRVKSGDFVYKIPSDYYYDKRENGLLITNSNNDWSIYIRTVKQQYKLFQDNKDKITTFLVNNSFTVHNDGAIRKVGEENEYLEYVLTVNLNTKDEEGKPNKLTKLIAIRDADEAKEKNVFYVEIVLYGDYERDQLQRIDTYTEVLEITNDILNQSTYQKYGSTLESVPLTDEYTLIASAADAYNSKIVNGNR